MKVSSLAPLRTPCTLCGLVLIALASGCRSNDAQLQQSYITELRQQEDEIYRLEDYLAEYQEIIRQQRAENAALRSQLATKSGKAAAKPPGELSLIPSGDDAEGPAPAPLTPDTSAEPTDDATDDPGDLPEIDLGEPTMPDIDLGEPLPSEELDAPAPLEGDTSDARATPDAELVSSEEPSEEFVPPPMPTEPADSVAIYAEQVPAEAEGDVKVGLLAIVEPLRRDGTAGTFDGPLSLLVIDPVASEDKQQLARWDLSSDEVAAAWRDTSRRVLDFALALPDDAPLGRPLELWVRLEPPDGAGKLLSHTTIELAPAVRLSGVAASGGPTRPVDGDGPVQTSWTAATDPTTEAATDDASWRAASTPPPAELVPPADAQPLRPRPATALRAPDWSPTR